MEESFKLIALFRNLKYNLKNSNVGFESCSRTRKQLGLAEPLALIVVVHSLVW